MREKVREGGEREREKGIGIDRAKEKRHGWGAGVSEAGSVG
jgi:hypothetical protein